MSSKVLSLFAVFVFGIGVGFERVFAMPISQDNCYVTGTVFDLQDAVVPGQKLYFKKGSAIKTIETGKEGNYKVSLAPGSYEILIRRGVDFWNYLRSEVRIDCEAQTYYNFYVTPECVSFGCGRLGFSFDVLENGNYPKLVFAYSDRKQRNKTVTYSNVLLTFGEYTVRAKEINLKRETHKIMAKGGWIEIGDNRERFSERYITIADQLLSSPFKLTKISDRWNVRRLLKLSRTMQH